jgi:amino acid transporter
MTASLRWVLAMTVAATPTLAHAAPPPSATAHAPALAREGRQELIAGITLRVIGTAAFYAAMSVRGLGGPPAYTSEAEAERRQRISTAMVGVALTGAAFMIAGAVLTGLGINRLYRSRGLALRPDGLALRF